MCRRDSLRAADVIVQTELDKHAAQAESAIPEDVFHSLLTLERKRAERSRKQFVLMLMDAHLENGSAAGILKEAVEIVIASKRETDLIGWYRQAPFLESYSPKSMPEPTVPSLKFSQTRLKRHRPH